MTGRHTGAVAYDGCRNRTPRGLLCGHNYAAHDLPDGGCSVCPDPTCPRYLTNRIRTAVVIAVLAIAILAVLVLSGAFS